MLPYYENRTNEFFSFTWRGKNGWPQHLHHQIEIVFVTTGFADVTIDFRTRRLYSGDLAIVFPHCVHGYQISADCPPDNLFWGIMVVSHLIGDFNNLMSQHLPREPFVSAETLGKEGAYVVQQLFKERSNQRPFVTKAYLQLLLALIWPALNVIQEKEQRLDDTPHRAIRYVVEHYRQPLQAKEIAAALGITQSHLARIFSQRLHMGFNDYVNRLRVQTAQDLLRSTNRPITEIMLDVGFESQSTFNRAFREIHGCSPREYRQQVQTNLPQK